MGRLLKKPAYMGLLLTFSLILSYVETLLPMPFALPGMKLGLGNLAVLLTLYLAGGREAFLLNLLRILLSGFLFGSLYGILYSMAGAALSFLAMLAAKGTGRFGVAGVSMAGGVFHNVGQLLAAALIVRTKGLFWYLPPLLLSGVVTGFLIGAAGRETLRALSGLFRRLP